MAEYIFRKATEKDIPFLVDLVMAAEKGMSDKLSYSTLFNLPEAKIKEYLTAMFEEDIDGCELSVSSYLIAEHEGVAVAGLGAWLEGLEDGMVSSILKSNLISYTFPKESIEFLKTKADILKSVFLPREQLTLQIEYLYVTKEHTGKKLDVALLEKLEENALLAYPQLKKVQGQLFKNSMFSIKLLLKQGYKITATCKCDNDEIFDYLPFNEKILMEKNIQ